MPARVLLLTTFLGSGAPGAAPSFSGTDAPHVVLVAGDEEYRSEEALPLLAGILAKEDGAQTAADEIEAACREPA